jgi:hypothetical protein
MYSVATYRLSLAADYTPLQTVSHVMIWAAFGAWVVAVAGLAHVLLRALRRPPARSTGAPDDR